MNRIQPRRIEAPAHMNDHDDNIQNPGSRPTKRGLPHRLATLATLAVPLLLALAGTAGAATVTLDPSSATVNANGTLTVALRLDATSAPGTHPGRYYGQVVVDYDPALLNYTQFVFASGITAAVTPVLGTSGNLKTITLGFDQALDTSTIGTFTFSVLNKPGSTAALHVKDADAFFGTFISRLPTNQPFYPGFVNTSVSIVPLPATAALLLSGLATLGAGLRRPRP